MRGHIRVFGALHDESYALMLVTARLKYVGESVGVEALPERVSNRLS